MMSEIRKAQIGANGQVLNPSSRASNVRAIFRLAIASNRTATDIATKKDIELWKRKFTPANSPSPRPLARSASQEGASTVTARPMHTVVTSKRLRGKKIIAASGAHAKLRNSNVHQYRACT